MYRFNPLYAYIYEPEHKLSFKAQGILCWLKKRSRRPKTSGKPFTLNEVIRVAADGRESVRSGLKELIEVGFVCRCEPEQDSQGRFMKGGES